MKLANLWTFLEQGFLCTGKWFAGEVVDPFSFSFSLSDSLKAVVVFEVISLVSLLACLLSKYLICAVILICI